MTELTATLIINISDSECGHCGKPTLLRDRHGTPTTHHTDISGYTPKPGGGCGARFVNTVSGHGAVTEWHLRDVRPDLPVRARKEQQ